MDPNANLQELRALVAEQLADRFDHGHPRADRMADLFESLDNWIRNGGFLPRDWERNAQ